MFDDELYEYHVLPHGEPESTDIKRRKPTEFNRLLNLKYPRLVVICILHYQ